MITNTVTFQVHDGSSKVIRNDTLGLTYGGINPAHTQFKHDAIALSNGQLFVQWGEGDSKEIALLSITTDTAQDDTGAIVPIAKFKSLTPNSRIKANARWTYATTSPSGEVLGVLVCNIRIAGTETNAMLTELHASKKVELHAARAGQTDVVRVARVYRQTAVQTIVTDRLMQAMGSEVTKPKVIAYFMRKMKLTKRELDTLSSYKALGVLSDDDYTALISR